MYFNEEKVSNVYEVYEDVKNQAGNKALQKQIIKKVKNYDETDVFKVHEILWLKLGQNKVVKPGVNLTNSMYLARVSLILSDIRNYVRKPIHPDVCRHLVLENILDYNKAGGFGLGKFCTECGVETNAPLNLNEELHNLVIKYFSIANQYAWHLNIYLKSEIEKAKVLPTLDKLKLPGLKDAANSLGMTGFSALRKADLKDVLIKYCTN